MASLLTVNSGGVLKDGWILLLPCNFSALKTSVIVDFEFYMLYS